MQEKIEIGKLVADKIDVIEGVNSTYVDDYNKYGSFQVIAVLELDQEKKPIKKDFSLRKINSQIKKILKETTGVSRFGQEVDSPSRVYDKYKCRNFTLSTFTGYEKYYIMVDFVVVLPKEQVSIKELLR